MQEPRTVRQLLDDRGDTYLRLGVAIGWHPNYIEKVARGERPLSEKLRCAMASYFGVTPEQIATGSPRAATVLS